MFQDYDADDLEVTVSELLVATADGADAQVDDRVQQVLRVLRERMGMDVVFVSEFTGGERVFRYVDQGSHADLLSPGASDPLEESWCQRVVDGRLPEMMRDAAPYIAAGKAPATNLPIGTHLSTPVVLADGSTYGTLCTFSMEVNGRTSELDLRHLRYTAKLLASRLRRAPQPELSLQPLQP